MQQPRESNLFNQAEASLHARVEELEAKNANLQALVVELLDKNEQLRFLLADLDEVV